MQFIAIRTHQRTEIIDMTGAIQEEIKRCGLVSGTVTVYSPHTTAGITVNENADPDVKADMTRFLSRLIPKNAGFAHQEGNSDAHLKGSLMNFSQNFIVEDGRLQLGTWQGVFLMEFDGPRSREVWLKCIADRA